MGGTCGVSKAFLPPALEEIQIEVSGEPLREKYFGSISLQHTIEDVTERSIWLCKIAEDKLSRYPSLKKLIRGKFALPGLTTSLYIAISANSPSLKGSFSIQNC
jgi:hypothetical protein